MKKLFFYGVIVLFIVEVVFAQSKMTIIFKDGKNESIEINNILKIEFQRKQIPPLLHQVDPNIQQGIPLHEGKRYLEAIDEFSKKISSSVDDLLGVHQEKFISPKPDSDETKTDFTKPKVLSPSSQTPITLPLPATYIHDLVSTGVSPYVIKEPLNINNLTINQYNGAVSAAMEAMLILMGELSSDEKKRFDEQWAPLFDFPTDESIDYLNKLNPYLSEFLSLRAAIATAADEFDSAWEEAVLAASYGSEEGVREALAIAEKQKDMLTTLQARMSEIVKTIQSLGNPPDVKEAKTRARRTHKEAVKIAKKVMKKEAKTEPKRVVSSIVTASIKKEGDIRIIPSTEIVTSASTIEVRAEVPPHIADKAKEYRWQSRGTYPITMPATGQPTVLLATDYFGDIEDITIKAFDAYGKEIGSGRLVIPMKSNIFIYDTGQYTPKMAGKIWRGPHIEHSFETPEEVSTYQTKTNVMHRDGTTKIEIQHHYSKLSNNAQITIHFANPSESETLRKPEEIREIYEQFQIGENKSKSFYELSIGDFTGKIYEYQWGMYSYPGRSYTVSGEGYLTHKGVNACAYGLYVTYQATSYAYHCPIHEFEQPCAQKFRNNFHKWKDFITKAVTSVKLGIPEESEKLEKEKVVNEEDIENKEERIAFHEANIRIIESNIAKYEEELSRENDPERRASLQWRILQGRSDLQAERDLIDSIRTGVIVHNRTPFDEYAHAQFINNIKENQRRMEAYQRTITSLNRLAGMLPSDEAEDARAFIKRQLPLETMANMDIEQARKVADALHEKVQGYYQKESAKQEEKAAWASFGMEAAQNIKTAADTGLFACSLLGGKGIMIAYQGITGYIEGGPTEAITRAASWYSTPTYVAAEAFKGYRQEGFKGAATNAAIAFISGKAYEYGATQLGKQLSKMPVTTPNGTVARTSHGTPSSTLSVREYMELTQFKQARIKGETVVKEFKKAQAELQLLGRSGASPQEILKQQDVVRKLAVEINANPHAKNYLKYKGDALSQRGYNAYMRAVHAEVEANFHEAMKLKGWNKQELKEFRNASSSGSVGMDYDIGLVEKPTWIIDKDGKMRRNNWLTKDGQPQTVEKWQKDAQEAWNESYRRVTGKSAERSWETVTTSAHLESYKDLALLGKDKSAVNRLWAEQSADVTRYKMHHMLNDPALSYMEKLQEISRGAAKDMETKLMPLLKDAKPASDVSAEALKKSQVHWENVHKILKAFGENTIDPIKANRMIRKLSGGKSIPEVVDDATVIMEGLIKWKK
ncbi:MAG: hypothetical protein N2596_03095 [Syntrophorhabdaceae bacterium]|nr:hypothetical protein [Syntrophorhabdaceae bacterium]